MRTVAHDEEFGVLAGEGVEGGAGVVERSPLAGRQDLERNASRIEHRAEHAFDVRRAGEQDHDGRAHLAHPPPEREPQGAWEAAAGDLTDRQYLPGVEGGELDLMARRAQQKDARSTSNRVAFKHRAWVKMWAVTGSLRAAARTA